MREMSRRGSWFNRLQKWDNFRTFINGLSTCQKTGRRAPTARAAPLRQQAPAAGDRERSLPGQAAHAADRRFSVLSHGPTYNPGVRSHAVASEGVWLCGRMDGAGAEPAAHVLLWFSRGSQSLKRGPVLTSRAAYLEFATSPPVLPQSRLK